MQATSAVSNAKPPRTPTPPTIWRIPRHESNWKGLLTDDSLCSGSRFAAGVTRRIYQHAIAVGYLSSSPGESTIVDPFCGVASGALAAMQLGCDWYGIEDELPLLDFARQNLNWWQTRWGMSRGRVCFDTLSLRYALAARSAVAADVIVTHPKSKTRGTVHECASLLRPGGVLYVALPPTAVARWKKSIKKSGFRLIGEFHAIAVGKSDSWLRNGKLFADAREVDERGPREIVLLYQLKPVYRRRVSETSRVNTDSESPCGEQPPARRRKGRPRRRSRTDPTPNEIERRAAEIRRQWKPWEEERRRIGRDWSKVEIPNVRMGGGGGGDGSDGGNGGDLGDGVAE